MILRRTETQRQGSLGTLLLTVALVVSTGCSWGTISREEFERGVRNGEFSENLLDGSSLAELLAAFASRRGGGAIRTRSLLVTRSFAVLEAQDPHHSDVVERYEYRDGKVGDGRPVQTDGLFEADMFNVDEPAVDKFREIVTKSTQLPGHEGARVRSLLVQKWKGNIEVRIELEGAGRSAVIFDAYGNLRRTDDR